MTQICEGCFYNCFSLNSIEFASDSELEVIEKYSFHFVPIESITIPAKVKKLDEGWCKMAFDLIEVKICPENLYFKNCEENEKLIVGKSDVDSNEYGIYVLACKDIKNAIIPPNIKQITSYTFSKTEIENILIPSHVNQINKNCFYECTKHRNITIPKDSELKFIGKKCILLYKC